MTTIHIPPIPRVETIPLSTLADRVALDWRWWENPANQALLSSTIRDFIKAFHVPSDAAGVAAFDTSTIPLDVLAVPHHSLMDAPESVASGAPRRGAPSFLVQRAADGTFKASTADYVLLDDFHSSVLDDNAAALGTAPPSDAMPANRHIYMWLRAAARAPGAAARPVVLNVVGAMRWRR
eukprot:TRINITY_DN38483_c0_g1_i1.p1 TRINITY_DN38483_c0_g1~~TRINITY_DN38483_c0_g1_i1.p1  ORF type:complete len:180 (+),score=18.16 TRINITY_DN38483_c0_g1_i1:137-676(+)